MVTSPRADRNTAQDIPAGRAIRCNSGQESGILLLHTQAPSERGPYGGDTEVRLNPIASLFAATLITMLPVHALAQDVEGRQDVVSVRERERPELDPLGVRLGGFTLNASVDLDVTSTDNLFAAPSGLENDDIIYSLSPRARLSSNWSRNQLALDAGAAFRSHEDFSSEDADTSYIRANGRWDVSADTAVHGSAGMSHEYIARTDSDILFMAGPVEFDRTEAAIGISHRFARLGVRLDAFTSDREYDATASFRDYDQTGLRGRADYEISPRVGIFATATTDERDYGNNPASNSEGRSLLVGVAYNGDLFRGDVSVGQFEREYDNPAFGTLDGLAVAGRMEWYVTPLTTVTVDASRTADNEVGLASGVPYINTEYGARIDHELLRNVILTAGIRSGEREYEGTDRTDESLRYDVGADYIINRRVALRARYTVDDIDSTVAVRNFEVEAVSIGLSLRL